MLWLQLVHVVAQLQQRVTITQLLTSCLRIEQPTLTNGTLTLNQTLTDYLMAATAPDDTQNETRSYELCVLPLSIQASIMYCVYESAAHSTASVAR